MRNRVCGRLSTAKAVVTLACASLAAHAQGGAMIHFELPAQPLADALRSIASQTHINVLFDPLLVRGLQAAAIKADLTPREALTRLLSGTGIQFEYVNDTTVVIAPGKPSQNNTGQGDSGGLRGNTEHVAVEEVVVTAQKREELLQDVPIPVTAVNAKTLVENNLLRVQDYASTIPNLNVTTGVQSNQALTIRGITSVGGNPTVAVLVDDAPFTASTDIGSGSVVPDIDPSDLARVEVLRGPQGSLYGASSMGGVLKFVTTPPSTAGFSGHVQVGVSGVSNGDSPGYNVRGSVNVPLSDTVAIAASAFTREDPGYIDNVLTGQNGINEDHARGGHLAALWSPSSELAVKLSALYQKIDSGGSNDFNEAVNGYVGPPVGSLQQSYPKGVGPYEREIQQYSANLTARVAGMDLTAISAYGINKYNDSFDLTFQFGPAAEGLYGVGAAPVFNSARSSKFSQEVRLSAALGAHFEWLLGGFYTNEDSSFGQNVAASDPVTGQIAGSLVYISVPTRYRESAGFANFTYHFTDQLDIQIGGRESHISQTYTQLEGGPAVGGDFVLPQVQTSANVFTYLVTPQWKLSKDFMIYARLASGYRPGGPNANPGNGVAPAYNPDKTKNYEIGAKAGFLDRKLTVDASLYYIDWSGIQISLLNDQTETTYNANGGKAKSEGAELSVEARPLEGLTVSAWTVWSDAVLTSSFPAASTAYGISGDRLPYSSRFSGNFSLQEELPLWRGITGFAGGSVSYRSGWVGTFQSDPTRQTYSGYATADVRAGLKTDTWTINVYVNNVADRRLALVGGIDTFPPWSFWGIQPRTSGLNVLYTFGGR